MLNIEVLHCAIGAVHKGKTMLASVPCTVILGTLSYPLVFLFISTKISVLWRLNRRNIMSCKLSVSLSFLCPCKDDSCPLLPYVFTEKAIKIIKKKQSSNVSFFFTCKCFQQYSGVELHECGNRAIKRIKLQHRG